MTRIYVFLAILAIAIASCNNKTADNFSDMEMDSSVTMDGIIVMDSIQVVNNKMGTGLPNNIEESKMMKIDDSSENKYSLSETKWILVQLNNKEVQRKDKENYINLDSKAESFNAYAGCNNINGSYVMEKSNKLIFSKITSTRIACNDGSLENEFLKALESSQTYKLNEDELLLFNGRKQIIKFKIK